MAKGNKSIRKIKVESTKTRQAVQSLSAGLGRLRSGAFALAGIGGFGALVTTSLTLGKELRVLSKLSNASFEEFQRARFAAREYGVEQDKLADIYKDTNEKLGEFLDRGTGPLVDFFERIAPRVGVTAEMFKNLSGPEALQLYYKSLEKANVGQKQTVTYMEEIASDASLLIPLLQNGGKEFERLGDKAVIMSNRTVERLAWAQNQIKNFTESLTIRFAEVIAGTENYAALKELGFRLMAVAGRFGGLIRDHIRALANVINAGIGGSLEYVATRFGDALSYALDQFRKKLMDIRIEFAEKNPLVNVDEFNRLLDKRDQLDREIGKRQKERDENAQKTWGDFFDENILEQGSLADEYSSYWTKLADEQRDLLRKSGEVAAESIKATQAQMSGARDGFSKQLSTGAGVGAPPADPSQEGFNIQRMTGESIEDFIRRREKARRAYLLGGTVDGINGAGGMGDLTMPASGINAAAGSKDETLSQMLEQLKIMARVLTTGTA